MKRHWNTSKICKGNSVTYSMKYSLILLQCELANFMLPLVLKSPYLIEQVYLHGLIYIPLEGSYGLPW